MKKSELLSRIFFPEKCPLCGETLNFNENFCLCCGSEEVKLSDRCCEKCGKEKEMCSCDTPYTTPLSHITGVFTYDGIIKNKLIFFKFGGRKSLYRYFGDCLAERVATVYAETDFDTVTFVPSSEERMKERGYNPSKLIAERTAKKLFLPCEDLLLKSKDTEKQHTLKANARITNIKGSISPKGNPDLKGKTVLLCDDIKTTGATLGECEKVLLNQGASDVFCAAIAITSNLNFFDLDKEDKNK